MNEITAAIAARQTQITQLQNDIETLQRAASIMGGGKKTPAKATRQSTAKPQPKPKRRPMTASLRAAVGKRMKASWAKRKKASAAAAATPARTKTTQKRTRKPRSAAAKKAMSKRGLDIIGDNAVLYAGIAYVYWNYVNIGIEQEEYIDKAEEYANKALALNAQSAEAHLVLGLLDLACRGNQRAAVDRLKQSAGINSDDPHSLFYLVIAYFTVGRAEAAGAAARRLKLIDPLTPMSRMAVQVSDLGTGQYKRALDFPWHEMPPLPLFVMNVASLCALAQQDELALDWLTTAVEQGFINRPSSAA